MAVAIINHTDASVTFGGTGTWTTESNASAYGGNVRKNTSVGATVTINWTGRALLIMSAMNINGADFTVTTDGVTRPNVYATGENPSTVVTTLYRTPFVLERGLSDSAHTTVITAVAGGRANELYFNAYMPISGAKFAPILGNINSLGHSWPNGIGASHISRSFPYVLTGYLSEVLSRHLKLTTRTAIGAAHCSSQGNLPTCIEQIIAAATDSANGRPEFMTIDYGINDLRTSGHGVAPGLYIQFLRTALILIEEVFKVGSDAASMKVSVGSIGHVPPYNYNGVMAVSGDFNASIEGLELALIMQRRLIDSFGWCNYADIYEMMNRSDDLIRPNFSADGLHPNNSGHKVIANAHLYALVPVNPRPAN